MHGEGFFFQAFVYLMAAVVSVPIAKRLGLGSVLGYLLAGIVIGPFGLHLIGEEGQDVMHFAEFGVVMMLFLIGLELEPSLLWRLRGPILGLGGLQVGLTTLLVGGIAVFAAGLPWNQALAVGLILALSSTAIVLQTLAEKGLMKTEAGQNAFAVLLFQDMAVIPMLALMPLLAIGSSQGAADATGGHGGGHTPWVETLPPWGQGLAVLGAVAVVIVGGRFLTSPLFRFIASARLREVFTAAALLLVIGIALLMTRVGLSPALGTFLAGVVLANSEYRHELEGDIEPFKGLLLGLFFISVGAAIDFQLIGDAPGLIAMLVVGLVGLKLAVLLGLAKGFKMSLDQGLLFAFALAQGGEFAFVLVSFATQNHIFGADVSAPLIAAVAVSMALTPLLLMLAEKVLLPRFGTLEETDAREPDAIDEENPVIIAGFGRTGAVVGRFLRANGVRPTILDINSEKVEVLRKVGIKVFYGDACRLDLLSAAGADKARLLILAIDSVEKTHLIAETARKHFPNLRVMATVATRHDAYEILDTGVEDVYREALDSALRLGVDALGALGFRSHQAMRSARKFRCYEVESFKELYDLRHDEKLYMNTAKQKVHDLERLLISELETVDEDRDAGWDVESIRRDFGSDSRISGG
ncbi:MAG: monovalent cation:proton antiporter-2 (CPA2) family protein [Deltaproteobacteria bacterium]|nr:monovalent cation:proton antiporter-2 (CPA2) family protein [Deltaproteobacteria bacterium]